MESSGTGYGHGSNGGNTPSSSTGKTYRKYKKKPEFKKMLTVKDAPDFKISKSYVPCTFTDEFKHYSHEADNYTSVILTTGLDQLKHTARMQVHKYDCLIDYEGGYFGLMKAKVRTEYDRLKNTAIQFYIMIFPAMAAISFLSQSNLPSVMTITGTDLLGRWKGMNVNFPRSAEKFPLDAKIEVCSQEFTETDDNGRTITHYTRIYMFLSLYKFTMQKVTEKTPTTPTLSDIRVFFKLRSSKMEGGVVTADAENNEKQDKNGWAGSFIEAHSLITSNELKRLIERYENYLLKKDASKEKYESLLNKKFGNKRGSRKGTSKKTKKTDQQDEHIEDRLSPQQHQRETVSSDLEINSD